MEFGEGAGLLADPTEGLFAGSSYSVDLQTLDIPRETVVQRLNLLAVRAALNLETAHIFQDGHLTTYVLGLLSGYGFLSLIKNYQFLRLQ